MYKRHGLTLSPRVSISINMSYVFTHFIHVLVAIENDYLCSHMSAWIKISCYKPYSCSNKIEYSLAIKITDWQIAISISSNNEHGEYSNYCFIDYMSIIKHVTKL